MQTVTLIQSNPVVVREGIVRVDRKFHEGMLSFVRQIRAELVAINRAGFPGESIMDEIEIPEADVPYRVIAVQTDRWFRVLASERPALRQLIAASRLVYCYEGAMGLDAEIRALGVPYVVILEHDLDTRIKVATVGENFARRFVRSARITWDYKTRTIPRIRSARAVHCNGYPAYDVARSHNADALLYFDSRMSREMLITRDGLEARLAKAGDRGQRLRLLYSGRYEGLKGADHAVRVGVECLRRNMNVEMHCYGQGALQEALQKDAAQFPDRVQVHDAVPYPELVRISRTFDVFVCCHMQGDPSCTYLESFGAGLPIVGYDNRMWARLCAESGAGLTSPTGKPELIAADLHRLAADRPLLAELSRQARAFAAEHTFEVEFKKRTEAINASATQALAST